MRYGVLSDVHGNLHALAAVLVALAEHDVDLNLCAGDLVGYGPHPDECVALLAGAGVICVAGNHDRMAVGQLGERHAGVLARDTLAWTRQTMSARTRGFLEGLPGAALVEDVMVAHGSPDDVEEYVRDPERAGELLSGLPPDASFLVLGHTHHQWAVGSRRGTVLSRSTGVVELPAEERHLLNPGSVGQSRDGDALARYLVLDTTVGTADFRAVPYDVAGSDAALRQAGLPVRALNSTNHSVRELARGARRRVRARVGRSAVG